MSLLLLVPSRGRPQAGQDALNSFLDTRTSESTRFLLLLDDDDPTWHSYPTYWAKVQPAPGSMNAALNMAARNPDVLKDASVVGFVGDDMRTRTKGWDEQIEGLLALNPGIAYGNDLYQGENLASNWFVSRSIVDAFGMSVLPSARHLYLDNAWMALGNAADCLYYLPDVVVEHLHPHAGKAAWDENYARVNDPAVYGHDGEIYARWLAEDLAKDAEKLRGIVG